MCFSVSRGIPVGLTGKEGVYPFLKKPFQGESSQSLFSNTLLSDFASRNASSQIFS